MSYIDYINAIKSSDYKTTDNLYDKFSFVDPLVLIKLSIEIRNLNTLLWIDNHYNIDGLTTYEIEYLYKYAILMKSYSIQRWLYTTFSSYFKYINHINFKEPRSLWSLIIDFLFN